MEQWIEAKGRDTSPVAMRYFRAIAVCLCVFFGSVVWFCGSLYRSPRVGIIILISLGSIFAIGLNARHGGLAIATPELRQHPWHRYSRFHRDTWYTMQDSLVGGGAAGRSGRGCTRHLTYLPMLCISSSRHPDMWPSGKLPSPPSLRARARN